MSSKLSLPKQRIIFGWVFGSLYFLFIAFLILRPEPIPEDRRSLVAVSGALMAALFATFLLGKITLSHKISKPGKGAIVATGSFAIFVLVFFGLMRDRTGDEVKPAPPTNRVTVSVNGIENGTLADYWAKPDLIEMQDPVDVGPNDLNRIVLAITAVLSNAIPPGDSFTNAQISFSPDRFMTNVTLVKTTRTRGGITLFGTRMFGTKVTRQTPKKTLSKVEDRQLVYPPPESSFDVYYWRTENGRRVSVSELATATNDFLKQSGSIILQLTRPGFSSMLVMFSADQSLKKPVSLQRRQPRIVLECNGLSPSVRQRIEASLERDYSLRILEPGALSALEKVMTNRYPLKTQADLETIQAELTAADIDCVVNVTLDRPGRRGKPLKSCAGAGMSSPGTCARQRVGRRGGRSERLRRRGAGC